MLKGLLVFEASLSKGDLIGEGSREDRLLELPPLLWILSFIALTRFASGLKIRI